MPQPSTQLASPGLLASFWHIPFGWRDLCQWAAFTAISRGSAPYHLRQLTHRVSHCDTLFFLRQHFLHRQNCQKFFWAKLLGQPDLSGKGDLLAI